MHSRSLATAVGLVIATIGGATLLTPVWAQTWGSGWDASWPSAPSGNDRTAAPSYAPPTYGYGYPVYGFSGPVVPGYGNSYAFANQGGGRAYCTSRFRSYDPGVRVVELRRIICKTNRPHRYANCGDRGVESNTY